MLSKCRSLTHPGGLHNFLPGGRSSRLFRGTIPMAACMIVMNFLNFIFQFYSWLVFWRTFAQLFLHNRDSLIPSCHLRISVPPWRPITTSAPEVVRSLTRGYYDSYLRKMTPTDVLLASPWEEDEKKKKKDRHVSARWWGIMARHSYVILELLSTL